MKCDILIIGAGMAGASAGYALAGALGPASQIVLLEGESQPGYHSTGRSASLYEPGFGNATVRVFNIASAPFLRSPPAGFSESPLMTPRGEITVADQDHRVELDHVLALDGLGGHDIREISPPQALAMIPILRPGQIRWACHEPEVMDMDVTAIHRGFLKGFAARDGRLLCDAPVHRIENRSGSWRVQAGTGTIEARIVVNAAGAWADSIAALAGLAPLGLQPKRRTAAIVAAPAGMDIRGWPALAVAGEDAYFKPDAGKLLVSPGDATPVEPQDVQPEELDIARLVEWLEATTTLCIRRVERRWAGLRTFASDNSPVLGEDPDAPGFWWLAGQGGYGIMMAESLARSLAALMGGADLPADVRASGVTPDAIAPGRLRGRIERGSVA